MLTQNESFDIEKFAKYWAGRWSDQSEQLLPCMIDKNPSHVKCGKFLSWAAQIYGDAWVCPTTARTWLTKRNCPDAWKFAFKQLEYRLKEQESHSKSLVA